MLIMFFLYKLYEKLFFLKKKKKWGGTDFKDKRGKDLEQQHVFIVPLSLYMKSYNLNLHILIFSIVMQCSIEITTIKFLRNINQFEIRIMFKSPLLFWA